MFRLGGPRGESLPPRPSWVHSVAGTDPSPKARRSEAQVNPWLNKRILQGERDSNASGETAGNTEKPSSSDGGSEGEISRNGGKSRFSRHLATGSRPFALRVAELEAAIATVTRALGAARDDEVVLLVTERTAMRAELRDARTALGFAATALPTLSAK
jgi:hypothetical protein